MKLQVVLSLCAVLAVSLQAPSPEQCGCEITNSGDDFPHDKLSTADGNASDCNRNITPNKTVELESLLLGLERRIAQLHKDVSVLEREDDGELYGVLSLYVIENEMVEIRHLMDRLNSTTETDQHLTADAVQQLRALRVEMREMETFDTAQVVRGRLDNELLRMDLNDCQNGLNATPPPTQPPPRTCAHGQLQNVTGPRVFTKGEYPGSYPYGAWGRDPEPEPGKESWYWLVMMTSGNKFSNYIRLYSSLSSLIVGKSVPGNVDIHPSNPTTNTIQGPNNVLYRGALYYNCYNQPEVCRFNLTTKKVTNFRLPEGTRYNSKGNFCQLDECYPFTDLDLATDESGVWVTYTTSQDFGNLVLSKVEEGEPPRLGQTWHTSIYKQAITNTFMACGVLYATRFKTKGVEEIFYALDTVTGKERFNLGILMNKMAPKIQALNYSPVDQMLHAYSDANMVSYKALFA
ncbi:olfactomedin-4 [Salarias fasciatus]|uniref:Olfactomedin-4-like n=1 Tax=Salarias fasciatus TaxID=181472 RepID=A0A672JE42_SALFA|nr:olfactomedin-4-like [Salarias fasciatus]